MAPPKVCRKCVDDWHYNASGMCLLCRKNPTSMYGVQCHDACRDTKCAKCGKKEDLTVTSPSLCEPCVNKYKGKCMICNKPL